MEANQIFIKEHLELLVITLFWSLLALFIVFRKQLYRLPTLQTTSVIKFWHVLVAFLVYFLSAVAGTILFTPVYLMIKEYAFYSEDLKHDPEFITGIVLANTVTGLLFLTLYLFLLKKNIRMMFFSKKTVSKAIAFLKGIFTWLLGYPFAALVSTIIGILLFLVFDFTETKQSAILYLRETLSRPSLFIAMSICIIFLVPIAEETLYRGFLQSWLRQKMPRWGAILVTAFVFACSHYSYDQGLGNFDIIPTLFTLALFLGVLYERLQTLWAPIGLHMIFNFISVSLLLLSSEPTQAN